MDTDAGKAEHNTVTVNNGKVSAAVYGGAARGAGNADNNTVRIKGAATEIASIYGGFARGTGNATGNKVYFDAGTVSFAEWMVGGQVGRSGNAEDNLVEVNGGKTSSLYGGVSSSSDATGHILRNHVRVHRGTIDGKVYGGVLDEARATGDVTHNTVMVKGGVLKREIYGGAIEKTNSTGSVMNNEVTIAAGEVKNVLGGFVRGSGKLTGNVVTVTGGEIQGSVYAAMSQGNTSTIQNNVVNLGDGEHELTAGSGIAKYIFGAFGGNRSSYAGNTLNVKASARAKNIVNFNKVNFYFTDTLQPKLTLRDSMGTKLGSLSDITVHGSPYASSGTLIENDTSGGIIIRDGVTSVVTTGDTAEMTLSKSGDNKKINYTRLIFKGARAAETDGPDTWGGRSVIGNTTTDNIVAVDSGTYTNVYGGWTSGAGSTADSSKQKNSTLNKVTVSGTASVTGAVYGGFANVAGGKATGNEVTIEKTISGAVVGGIATGEASNNMVAIHANTGAVTGGISTGASASGNKVYLANVTVTSATGGDGAVTHNNEIHLNGNAHVTNALIGGTQANGTGNTLHVKGLNNTAGSIINVQKMTFDVTGAAQDSTLLNVTGAAQTHVNWASLTATGMAAKPLTLLKNAHGINLDGYTGAAKSATTDTTETNVDVRKMGNKITEITYEGYTFKGTTTATTVGPDTWGGRSKAGNTTTDNIITVDSGTHTNVYGGWTSGSGSTADSSKQKDSTLNKVTVSGTASVNGTVYGGFTDVAGGKATGNTVTAASDLVADIIGGKAAGEASHNTVTVGSAAVNSITGGDGAVTKDNTVNIDGATVANKIVGGTQAVSTGNTLNVKGVNTARNIGGFQKLHFDTTGVTGTMLTLNDGINKTKVDWNTLTVGGSGYNITLLKNAAGIDFGDTYTDGAVKSGLSADRQSEINVGVSADKKAITYSGLRFTGATQTLVDGTAAYGGISKAGNTTHHNAITVNGHYDAVYGGHTSGTSDTAVEKKHSHDNMVTITGGTLGTVYGGYTQIADGTTNDNTINLGDGTHPLAPNTTVAALYGGNKTAAGNTLNVNTSATVGKIENFSTVTFKNASSKLTLTQAGASIDLDTIKADFAATEREDVLVENANGLTLQVGKTFRTDLSADGTKETNIEARSGNKEIVRYGYTFKDARTATTVGADTWGGRSKAGNTTTGNEIALSSGTYTNVYGGWTSGAGSTADSSKQKNSTLNKVTVSGTASVTGAVYGGFANVAGGKATGNEVTIEKTISGAVVGGIATGEASNNMVAIHANTGAVTGGISTGASASGNKVYLANVTVTSATGGDGAVTHNNEIHLNGNAHVTNALIGGTQANGTGNTLHVKGLNNTAGSIINVQKMTFDVTGAAQDSTLLNVTGAAQTHVNWASLTATGMAAKPLTLLKNAHGINLDGYTGAAKSATTDTTETNVDVRKMGNKITEITYEGYTFKGTTTATTVGPDTWGGRSKAGNTTTDNIITVDSGTHTNVYGGWTSGSGSTADSSKQKDSTLNKVTVSGTASVNGTVYGGFTDVSGGSATGNTVSIDHATVNSVTGGYGAVTNNNRINLRGAKVTGIVTGGTAANATGNTLAVSYGMKTTEIGDFRGIQNLHFDMEKAPMDGTAHTMLKLTNVGGEKKLSDAHIDLRRDGAAEKLKVGDKITLMENTSGGITFGENLTANGTDGVTRDYEFAIASVDKTLIATVTKTSLGEQSKSFVETRTGASAFLNDGADFMAGAGLDAAKAEAARAAAVPGGAAYGLWAGMGGGALRHNTGSYVEMKGWNLGVGWARENAVPVGTLTFGPFLEYGRGSYDSYLDDGTHGDGTSSYIGAGVMAELAMRGGVRVDSALRAGRTKSDYTGLASYDTSNAYYGIQVGAGKDFRVSEAAAVSAYVRYTYTHTAGASAYLSTGETYEFDAVNSHRVRLGTRWMHGDTAHTQLYAGLAWEYEFDGAAHASYQGDRTPSPSLKGGSALLELGYRFAPKSSRVSYDLHLNGWQGKREGITGGVSVKWMF